jgi:hypothetical protein
LDKLTFHESDFSEADAKDVGGDMKPRRSAIRNVAVAASSWFLDRSRIRFGLVASPLALVAIASASSTSLADENGISFWVPGFFGSLAAPGWSLATIFESRVIGVGPQIGYFFPIGKLQVCEPEGLWGIRRAESAGGWNASLTFSLSPAAPSAPSASPIVTK